MFISKTELKRVRRDSIVISMLVHRKFSMRKSLPVAFDNTLYMYINRVKMNIFDIHCTMYMHSLAPQVKVLFIRSLLSIPFLNSF